MAVCALPTMALCLLAQTSSLQLVTICCSRLAHQLTPLQRRSQLSVGATISRAVARSAFRQATLMAAVHQVRLVCVVASAVQEEAVKLHCTAELQLEGPPALQRWGLDRLTQVLAAVCR